MLAARYLVPKMTVPAGGASSTGFLKSAEKDSTEKTVLFASRILDWMDVLEL
jgi:hypothetical protein